MLLERTEYTMKMKYIMMLFMIFILIIANNSCSRNTTIIKVDSENHNDKENNNNKIETHENMNSPRINNVTESNGITHCYTFGDRESLEEAKKYARQATIEKALLSKLSYFKTQIRYEKGILTDAEIISLTKGYIKNLNMKEGVIDYENRKICNSVISIDFENDAIQKIDEKIEESSGHPIFVFVPGKKYIIPEFLKVYLNDYYNSIKFEIIKGFKIMKRELSVHHFNQYYESLGYEEKKQLGEEWKKDDGNAPVENIPFKHVRGYARWLSTKLNKTVRLPSVEEWMATCIHFIQSDDQLYRFQPIVNARKPISEVRQSVDHLFGNLREWSISPCYYDANKYYLLGGNYISKKIGVYKAFCASENATWLGGVGIRLIVENN